MYTVSIRLIKLNIKKCVKCVLSKAGYRRKVLMRGMSRLICLKGFNYARLGKNSLGPGIWSRDKSALLLFAYFILKLKENLRVLAQMSSVFFPLKEWLFKGTVAGHEFFYQSNLYREEDKDFFSFFSSKISKNWTYFIPFFRSLVPSPE
jgi:hypothetical protein